MLWKSADGQRLRKFLVVKKQHGWNSGYLGDGHEMLGSFSAAAASGCHC